MPKPTVAILGASRDRRKFGNKSVRAHLEEGYEVFPVNPHAETIEGLKAYPDLASVPVKKLDRISVYLPPEVVLSLLEEIQNRGAKEVWFNPGSDSPEVVAIVSGRHQRGRHQYAAAAGSPAQLRARY